MVYRSQGRSSAAVLPLTAVADAATEHRAGGPACPVCGGRPCSPTLVKDGVAILGCPRCGLAFRPDPPDHATIKALYGREYFVGGRGQYLDYLADEWLHRRQARYYLRRLARYGRTGGTLLDVGCAAGFLLDEARRAGWRVEGCDVSAYMARHARDALHLPVREGEFLAQDYAAGSMDVVTLVSVLGHLPDPRGVERRLHELVRPGGLVLVEVWNRGSLFARLCGAHWHEWNPRYVLHYFARRTLGHLFEGPRWRLLSCRTSIKWISLRRGLHVLGPASETTRSDGLLGRIPVPYMAGDLALAAFERR